MNHVHQSLEIIHPHLFFPPPVLHMMRNCYVTRAYIVIVPSPSEPDNARHAEYKRSMNHQVYSLG